MYFFGVQESHFEHVIGGFVNGGELRFFLAALQLFHHGDHVYRLLIEVVVGNTFGRYNNIIIMREELNLLSKHTEV